MAARNIGGAAVDADTPMFVRFAVDGSVNGNGGCNNFFGSLESTDDGVAMGELGATRMACPPEIMDQEQAFMQALQDAVRFEMGDDSLQMLNADNALLAEFVEVTGDEVARCSQDVASITSAIRCAFWAGAIMCTPATPCISR